jgi:cytoskeleton protein RodZ
MIRNGFTKKSVGTLTLGEKLKRLRSDKRLSLNEVSRITKIQVAYLEYLEEGEWEKLPADVYVKGFLRSYGDFLGANERVLIKLYEKEKEIRKNVEESKNPTKNKPDMRPVNISAFVFTPKKIVIFLSAILIIAGLVYLYKEIGSFSDAPRLVILNPQTNATVENNFLYVEGITERDARLFINDQPVLVSDDGKFKESIALQSGVNVINFRATNKFGKETVNSVTVQSDQKEEIYKNGESNENKEEVPANFNEMGIEIKVDPGPVWVSVETDGSLVFSGIMLSGSVQNFSARDKIVINSGRANATYVKFNGRDIGTLGQDPGVVRGVTFNKDTKY